MALLELVRDGVIDVERNGEDIELSLNEKPEILTLEGFDEH
jgi:hypothetical protein